MKAKDLFADWYREVEVQPTSQKIDIRLKSIDYVVENNKDINFWLSIIKIYLGIDVNKIDKYEEFCTIFKKDDSSFPMQNNEQLIIILASACLCFRLESVRDYQNDAIATAITTSNFLEHYNITSNIPVLQEALRYIVKESIKVRENDELAKVDDNDIAFTQPDIRLENEEEEEEEDEDENEEVDGISREELIAPFSQISDTIKLIIERISTLTEEVNKQKQMNTVLSEEVNILWWIFGEYSITLQKKFKDVGILQTSLLAGIELSNFVKESPGVNFALSILDKVLRLSSGNEKSYSNISMFDSINSLPENIRISLNNESNGQLENFTPILLGINKSLELGQNEDWTSLFKRSAFGANPKKKKNPVLIAEQIYRELQLIKSYNLAK